MSDVTTLPPLARVLKSLGACDGPGESVEWATPFGTDWERAWAECPRGDWLLWLLGELGADRKRVVLAACDCAELALVHVPAGEGRPAKAIATARAWCRGEAALGEVRAAAAYAAAYAAEAETRKVCADIVRRHFAADEVRDLLLAKAEI